VSTENTLVRIDTAALTEAELTQGFSVEDFVVDKNGSITVLTCMGKAVRLGNMAHIVLSVIAQVEYWCCIVMTHRGFVASGWNETKQYNQYLTLDDKMNFRGSLQVPASKLSRRLFGSTRTRLCATNICNP